MKKFLAVTTLLAGLFGFAGASRADNITNVGLVDGEYVTFANGVYAGQSGLAGEIDLTTDTGGTIDAWCIDLYHDVYLGGQTPPLQYYGQSLVGASNGNGSFLTATEASEIAGLVEYGDALAAGAGATPDMIAGVQMAIWAIENPGLLFTAPTGAVSDEEADIALAPSLNGNVESLVSLTGTQELAADTNQIPEPGSLTLSAAGFLALGLVAQRRMRPFSI